MSYPLAGIIFCADLCDCLLDFALALRDKGVTYALLSTYSVTNCTESSLHFSVGSENSFKTGFKISSKSTCSTEAENVVFFENTSLLIFSRALFLVPLLSSARQLISL